MDQKIICRTEERPNQRKLRTDQALDIAPLLTVVPQAHLKDLETQDARDVLDQRHADRHGKKQQRLAPKRIESRLRFKRSDQKQKAKPEAVKRDIGPHAKARVDPLALRIGRRDEAAEQQLCHPADHGADEKQKRQYQPNIHVRFPPSSPLSASVTVKVVPPFSLCTSTAP